VAGVDVAGEAALYHLIAEIRDELGCGVLLVSHDLHVVMAQADRVVCLNRHICCEGDAHSVVRDPAFVGLFGARAAGELALKCPSPRPCPRSRRRNGNDAQWMIFSGAPPWERPAGRGRWPDWLFRAVAAQWRIWASRSPLWGCSAPVWAF